MKKIFILLLALTAGLSTYAQKDVTLNINHKMNDSAFAFNQATTNNLSNNISFTRVEYYISSIFIVHDGGIETPVTDKYLLVDCADGNLFSESLGSFNVTSVEGIKFSIGVDGSKNHDDPSQQPAGHPLAFQNPSMHWGWSPGYRFVVLEGKAGTNLANTFQLHGLFDRNYFSQTITAAGVDDGTTIHINLDADYAEALYNVNIAAGAIHHGDDLLDRDVLVNFSQHVFTASPTTPSKIENIDLSDYLNVYPIPSQGSFQVDLGDELKTIATEVQIVDILGRKVSQVPVAGQTLMQMNLDTHGMFFVQVLSGNQVVAANKLIIQ